MSPKKFQDEQQRRKPEINGPRPSPLKINKESQITNKPSSISSLSKLPAVQHQQQRRHPVIIYTHSPKIIHTQARDFMALVQKLTGVSSFNTSTVQNSAPPQEGVRPSSRDDNESSSASVLTDEHNGGGGGGSGGGQVISSYLADAPLFTPNSTNLFCSPGPLYRYPDPAISSPNMIGSISPSAFNFIKEYPEY